MSNQLTRILIGLVILSFSAKSVYAADLSQEYGFGGITSLGQVITILRPHAFQIAAAAVVIYFVYSAFLLVISAGDKEQVAKARNMITHSIIGFVLLILMFLIIQFIVGYFLPGNRIFGPPDTHTISRPGGEE